MLNRLRRCDVLFGLSILLTLIPSLSAGQTLAFDRDEFAAPVGTRGIVAVDLNADGWTDLALANTQPASVAVMLNRGEAHGFLLGRTVPLTGGPFAIAAGDFDKDGRVDLAVANADGNNIGILFTREASPTSWSSRALVSIGAPGGPRGLAVTDADGDGSLDIVYSAFYRNSVSVVYGNGVGGFSSRGLPAMPVGVRPQAVAAGDLNNDGLTDLVVANTGATLLTVLSRTGSSYTRRDIPGQQQLNVVIIADLNNDGWADAVAAATGRNVLAVYRGGAAGLAYSSSAPTGSSPRGIATADFNADGRADLVVANRVGNSVSVLVQQSSGLFALSDEVPSGSGARAVAAADFNRDGTIDFATGNEYAESISVFLASPGLPRAAYGFTRTSLVSDWRTQLGSGLVVRDMNHNGLLDIVAGNTVILDGSAASMRTLPLPARSRVKDVAALDYNRDGHADVAVLLSSSDAQGNAAFDGYYLFAGDGAGDFTFVRAAGGFGSSEFIRTADLNRDGWDDLVIASVSPANYRRSALYVLLNRRNGILSGVAATPLTGTVYSIAIGDVTADGKPDVVLSLDDTTSITVEIGDGSGAFSNEAQTSIERVAYDIELADVNRDGFLDFVVADSANVHVLTGDGRGHYIEKQTFLPTYRPDGDSAADALVVADLTDDGIPDIVTNYGLMLPGTEQGSFGPAEEFAWFWGHSAAADMDLDGDLDLVATSSYSVEILNNQRTTANQIPVADAGGDRTWSYTYQFEAGEFALSGGDSSDPDMHLLSYEWREDGEVIGNGRNLWPGYLMPGVHNFELIVRDGRGGEARQAFTWTFTHVEEIVRHVGGSDLHGTWQLVPDPAAANGYRLWNPNAGAPKVTSALASPINYIDIDWFMPDPTLEYKLWVRGRADGNHWANDSVFVQFSHAADAAGSPLYRIGTTSALAVNLEECSGCGISGWGWEDDGWGAVDRPGVTLRFPTAAPQTIRIQVREDGFSIDQIVFSARKYKTQRPGKAKNDTTILGQTQ